MMVDVPDNQQPGPGDPESRPPALRPQAPPPAAPMSAEETERWRQFQEFQRFQEFQKGSQFGSPTEPEPDKPRRTGRPVWKKVLFSKWLRRLVYLLVVVLLLNWAYEHYFGNPDEDLPAAVTGGGKTERTVLFETNPEDAVRKIYNDVALDNPLNACTRFQTAELAQLFADHVNAADCDSAVHRLYGEIPKKVGAVNAYANAEFLKAERTTNPDSNSDEVVFSSCGMDPKIGPRLGRFTAAVIDKSRAGQWTIVKHERETC